MSDETPYVTAPDVLASEPPAPGPRWGRRVAVGGAALAVVVLAAGGYAAYGALSGGGTQPDTLVPANAVGIVELDLNPPAGQKLNAMRLLHRLPKDTVHVGADNYRDALLQTIFAKANGIDYATDVDPWLGDRAAAAVLPPVAGGDSPTTEVVLQVKDVAKFKAAAPKLFSASGDGWVIRDGYVVISQDTDTATRLADSAAKADLADSSDYSLDTSGLGERIMTGWYDLSRAATLLPAATRASVGDAVHGRATFADRVEPDALELVANETGVTSGAAARVALLPKLPGGTVAALELTGGGQRVAQEWKQVLASMSSSGVDASQLTQTYKRQFGLDLPGDLTTLLGSDAVGAVVVPTDAKTPVFGYVSVTDPTKARALATRLGRLLARFGAPAPTVTSDGLAWGTSPAWAKEATSGDLGSEALVKQALPDLGTASAAVYVNVAGLSALSDDSSSLAGTSSVADAGVAAVGLTSTSDGSTAHLRVRVIFK